MSNQPKTFVNGRGETICTRCNSTMIGERYCDCNRHWRHGTIHIPLHREIPKIGDHLEIEVLKSKEYEGAELNIRVTEIKSVEWLKDASGLKGIKFSFRYSVEAVLKNGKPKLQLITGGGESSGRTNQERHQG